MMYILAVLAFGFAILMPFSDKDASGTLLTVSSIYLTGYIICYYIDKKKEQ